MYEKDCCTDFVFVFVGNVETEIFKEMIVKYIGSIPGNVSQKEDWFIIPNYLTKGNVERRFLYRMINPRTYSNVTYSLGMEYNLENYVLGNLLEAYLKKVFDGRNVKRLVTRADLSLGLKSYPESILEVNAYFETDSLNSGNVMEIMANSLKEAADGISAAYFTQLKKDIAGSFKKKSVTREYWLDIMSQRYMIGKDFHSNYIKVLDALGADDFAAYVGKLLNEGNKVSIIMDGTTKDVNTQNLFKEDEFIKDFFNVY